MGGSGWGRGGRGSGSMRGVGSGRGRGSGCGRGRGGIGSGSPMTRSGMVSRVASVAVSVILPRRPNPTSAVRIVSDTRVAYVATSPMRIVSAMSPTRITSAAVSAPRSAPRAAPLPPKMGRINAMFVAA